MATTAQLNSARKAIETAKKVSLERSRRSARKKSVERKTNPPRKEASDDEIPEKEKVPSPARPAQDKENARIARGRGTKVS